MSYCSPFVLSENIAYRNFFTPSKEQPRIENVVATMHSALGIDWTKEIKNTPSGRAYLYVDPLGPAGSIPTDEIADLYT